MKADGIGARVTRKEDHRFLTGNGQYTDDITLNHQTYASFVRSPHAHAKIKSVNTSAAAAMPGVIAIFTGADIAETKIGGLPCGWLINNKDGSPMKEPPHHILAVDKARYVGDQVAVVIAETIEQARAAMEAVEVDYDVLTPVVDTATASKATTSVHDVAADNVCFVWGHGDSAAVDAAIASAHHVSTLDIINNRLIPNAIEPRAANAAYDRSSDSYTLDRKSVV